MDELKEYGQIDLTVKGHKIHLLSIIGEIEGHDQLPAGTKATKYEHILPQLVKVAMDESIEGLIILLNTVGGDVECGLAIAELISSINKPTVSIVLGGSHSIGVPLAVAADTSIIVPTGTMVVHPVRMNGLFIRSIQTYEYFEKIQNRINKFIVEHCDITEEALDKLLNETSDMTKDVGTILVGQQAVDVGIINGIGGITDAMELLQEKIENEKNK